jgi:hypothetical protein
MQIDGHEEGHYVHKCITFHENQECHDLIL